MLSDNSAGTTDQRTKTRRLHRTGTITPKSVIRFAHSKPHIIGVAGRDRLSNSGRIVYFQID